MDNPTAAGDVLAQPTRARLFALLSELHHPATSEELAGAVGLHVNGVRRQLQRLREAGLVERYRVSHGRGRPRDEWAIADQASPGGERPRSYADLAGWLARSIPATPGRLRQIERSGREIGGDLVPPGTPAGMESFRQALVSLGFQPALDPPSGGTLCCRLGNCPYRDSVRENQEVVCTLHKGMTAGLIDRLLPAARLRSFEPHDPDLAGCLVEVAGADQGEE